MGVRTVRILALIRTLSDIRCVIRRKEVVKWLIDDVERTQDAQALEMLHACTKRIIPRGSAEEPADVFERILQRITPMRLKAADAAGMAEKKKKARTTAKAKATDVHSTSKPPMGGRVKNQPR